MLPFFYVPPFFFERCLDSELNSCHGSKWNLVTHKTFKIKLGMLEDSVSRGQVEAKKI